mmetsp:Transcript_3407/g.8807  ORF Transcript_3407/g.8807 Transcript_3407/m.8807 type:complete len:132 (-) Transcript_3407:102-497(-)
MAAYAAAYRTTLRTMVANGRELYPEAAMWEHLASVGGEARMRPLHGFHASLARPRPSGHPFYDDPFGKLRTDISQTVDAARLASVPRPPTNACIANVRQTREAGGRARSKGRAGKSLRRMLRDGAAARAPG